VSCVLRVSARDIETVLKSTALQPYRVEGGTAHFDVSKAAISDFDGQIADAIAFLDVNIRELEKIVAADPIEATLDFAVAWRAVAVQNDVLPAQLVRRAAEFGFAIELSHYPLAEGESVADA
jgi:hypothetical protein